MTQSKDTNCHLVSDDYCMTHNGYHEPKQTEATLVDPCVGCKHGLLPAACKDCIIEVKDAEIERLRAEIKDRAAYCVENHFSEADLHGSI